MGRVGLVPKNNYSISRIVERLNNSGAAAGCAIVFGNGEKEFVTDKFDVLVAKIDKEATDESQEQLGNSQEIVTS